MHGGLEEGGVQGGAGLVQHLEGGQVEGDGKEDDASHLGQEDVRAGKSSGPKQTCLIRGL